MCNTYNGYKNYETWNVSLWIDNDEALYNYVLDTANDMFDGDPDRFKYKLADWIKNFVEEMNPLADQANMYSDMLQAAIDNVDYYEIAENSLEVDREL